MTHHRHLGDLIHEQSDDRGDVQVFQRDRRRYLTFGNAVEQSCINLDWPFRLEYVYTQAMLLSLVLCSDVKSALVLGLGGGSLVRALRFLRPDLEIDAVETRAAVIEVAQQYFQLDVDDKLRLHCEDAQHYMAQDAGQYELIFADLYLAEGVHNAQVNGEFLALCRERLSKQGILLANQWCSEFRDSEFAQQAMQDAFGDNVLYLHVQGGNVIAFAFNGDLPVFKREVFYEAAQTLGRELDIPLGRLARNFWRQNAEPLQMGRFSLF